MAVLPAGTPAPAFSLARADGGRFTEADLAGRRTVLVFYPFAFTEGTKSTQGRIVWSAYG